MDLQQLFIFGIVSLTLVLVGGVGARFLFLWFDEYLLARGSKKEKDIERMVLREEVNLRAQLGTAPRLDQSRSANAAPKKEQGPLPQLEEVTDPAEKERRALMQRIFDFEVRPRAGEDELTFFRRLLSVPEGASKDECKRAFKKLAQKLHPDSFNLAGFDPKTKKRLEKRVHENYLVLQKALESLRR